MTAKRAGKPEPIPVTVTFLEMAKPPSHYPPLPWNRQVALLRVGHMPLHFYRYLMDRVGRPWHWVNMLRLDDEKLAAKLTEPGREFRVLYLDGVPSGFFEIAALSDHAELSYFGLMDHATGQGLGRWFLGAAIEAAWATGASKVKVQTCTLDHPAALPLYQRLGFNAVAQAQEAVLPMSPQERWQSVGR